MNIMDAIQITDETQHTHKCSSPPFRESFNAMRINTTIRTVERNPLQLMNYSIVSSTGQSFLWSTPENKKNS